MGLAGNFVVAWSSNQDPDGSRGVYAQRYNVAGVKRGGEFRVNVFTAGEQTDPSVAMYPNGAFVIAWTSTGQDDSTSVYARRYFDGGTPIGGKFTVNTYTPGSQAAPSVAADAWYGLVVAWQSEGQDGAGRTGVYAQRYDGNGSPLDGELPLNTLTAGDQVAPDLARGARGGFTAAWQGPDPVYSFETTMFARPSGTRRLPTVGTLADTPDPAVAGNSVTLSASGLVADGGSIFEVSFYRESNGEPGLQVGRGGWRGKSAYRTGDDTRTRGARR